MIPQTKKRLERGDLNVMLALVHEKWTEQTSHSNPQTQSAGSITAAGTCLLQSGGALPSLKTMTEQVVAVMSFSANQNSSEVRVPELCSLTHHRHVRNLRVFCGRQRCACPSAGRGRQRHLAL